MQKFKKGDKVKIIMEGVGCSPDCIGEIVTIISYDKTGYFGKSGYLTTKIKGHSNNSTGISGGYIGEESFKLVAPLTWKYKFCGGNKE